MRRLQRLKLANAIKCGPSEENFLQGSKFDLTIEEGIIIKCMHKETGAITFTSLMNAAWWTEVEEETPKTKAAPNPTAKNKPVL